MGPDWCDDGEVLKYSGVDLKQCFADLKDRFETRYRKRADWTEMNRCIQEDVQRNDSPYEQQLKNGFGLLPQSSSFITTKDKAGLFV